MCLEEASRLDQAVFQEVIVPLLGVKDTAVLGISTPLDDTNFYSQMTEMKQEDGKTPLHLACMHGHAEIMSMMIEGRPSRMKAPMMLGMRDDNKRTPLLCACCVSGNARCARVLLEAGADVNAEDGAGVRPLHLAAMQGDAELVAALLQQGGVDVDATDGQGRTALVCATMDGHVEVCAALLEGGADMSVRGDGASGGMAGGDATEWAVDLEHYPIVKLFQAHAAAAAAADGEGGGGEGGGGEGKLGLDEVDRAEGP